MQRNKSRQSPQVELRRFKTELADVEITADLQVTSGRLLKFADFFFDGLFTELGSSGSASIRQRPGGEYQRSNRRSHLHF